ncbi:hypothetical protein [Spirochaeta cellobiosiphila]|uniref:hypothetical protein n=1 Tax=Spirochaeta cellobiosiphila TaxID=504483 RepID=UPI0004208676|nr:hypothetical protein [Spirochaeta cellobiosiphila]
MNKFILLLISISLAVFSCATQAPQEEVVSNVETPEGEAKEPVLVPKQIQETIYVITKESSFYSDGILDTKFEGSYDEEGTPKTLTTFTNMGDVKEKLVYKKSGSTLTVTNYNGSNEVQDITVSDMNEYGWLVKEVLKTGDEEILSQSTYENNNNGDPTVWKAYDGDNALLAVTEYTYDEEGNKTKTTFSDQSGSLTGTIEYKYNKGNLVDEVYQNADGSIDKRIKREYKGDVLVKTLYYSGEKALRRQETYENDADGNAIKVNYLDKRGNLLEYKERTFEPRTAIKTILVWE